MFGRVLRSMFGRVLINVSVRAVGMHKKIMKIKNFPNYSILFVDWYSLILFVKQYYCYKIFPNISNTFRSCVT